MFNDEDPSLFQALGAKYKAYKHELVATAKVKMIEADLKVQQAEASYLRHQYACQIEFIAAQNKIQKLQMEQHVISLISGCTSSHELSQCISLLSAETRSALGISAPALPAPQAAPQPALPAPAANQLSSSMVIKQRDKIIDWAEDTNTWAIDEIKKRWTPVLRERYGSGANEILEAVHAEMGDFAPYQWGVRN